MSTLRIDADTEFHRYVERLATTTPVPGSSWSEDHATLRFLKRKATGYDIEVGYWPSNGILWLVTDRGYHHHVHGDEDSALAECLVVPAGSRSAARRSGGSCRCWEPRSGNVR